MKLKLVPEPSERTQRVIGAFGNFTPGFGLRMRLSLQLVIAPRKMSPRVLPSKLMPLETPSMWVTTVIGPISVGK